MSFLEKIKNVILDLIFPRECIGCGTEGSYLCGDCQRKIKINRNFYCVVCKKPTHLPRICEDCGKEYRLKAVFVAADYNDKALHDLIHLLKYKFIEEASSGLGEIVINYLEQNKIFQNFDFGPDNTVFVPVPLHRKRFLNRGFNQSDLIANHLSEFYKIPKKVLISRIRNTQSQVELKKSERRENVRDAFILSADKSFDKNKKIILVDDVVTTGSTLNECAKVFLKEGFVDVYGLVVAQRED
ncbi:MAG: ComF family protein [Patescibacteria group bacterium]|nr:ComF family protein [Patescibacteria group bacterium]